MSEDILFPPLGHPAALARETVGSKAAALSGLTAAGFPVPAGFVVTGTALAAARAQDAGAGLDGALQAAARRAGSGPYAVRSSAAAEDLPGASFAGMYESYLNVSAAGLAAAVERCCDAATADRIRAYESSLQQHRDDLGPAQAGGGMAVLVQQMVDAAAAGVAFTANPLTGDRSETVISAVPGLGESLVSGLQAGEEWIVRAGLPVPERGGGAVISGEAATAVAAIAGRIARHFGCPQDIEWAVDRAGHVQILQARPMTALPDPVVWEPPGTGFWVRNFRLGEWLPEPVTPLFMDWLVPRIDDAFNGTLGETLGVAAPVRSGVVNGWYYLSPPSPTSIPRMLFGGAARQSLSFFINAVLRPTFDPAGADRKVLRGLEETWRQDCLPAYKALIDSSRPAVPAATMPELIAVVDAVARQAGEYLWFISATGGAAWKMEVALGRYWRRHLAGALAAAAPGSENAMGYQVLLGGLSPLPAVVPHAVYSIDWYHPTAGERFPSHAESGGTSGTLPATVAAERRTITEAACRAVLRGTPRLEKFEVLLSVAQHYAILREEQVRDFTMGWPLLRRCAAELGARLHDRGIIAAPDDVYFVTLDALRTDAPPQQDAVSRRRAGWLRQRKLAAPLTLGKMPPLLGNAFDRIANSARSTRNLPGGAIVGHPASPGRAMGRVRVVDGPGDFAQFMPGEVLVARVTTPAWTPLFTGSAAVVTDGGNLAAHASLIAREYGIPAVVGTGNATHVLRTGQLVTVDGNAGTIETHEG
ncbi:PEP/pyruvate-binding domain-containing protein [Arthrobacter sp. P2b]|uniref:PEP/pyruvate-binding domain-containing protein n=1 Tax=Arthrobacter sp. P2b TaxID=1938741 RepID=UPI0009CA3AEE|nr:PEP/pyruvate-binding domain-containing protein [Arthrobacter sp. P2b]SLJ98125.1 pyruvate, water dikinase [Arthrobacter sp. P2b]